MSIPSSILALLACSVPVLAAVKPNVLILVSDDQGYADAGFQGGTQAVTPHLDALAKSGVRCTSGYVTYPVCSPSRAGLMTGRYGARFGHERNPVYDPLDEREGLPLTEKLLPEYFRETGYRTGWIGKWHLGSAPRFTPWQRGFDECFGFIGGGHRFFGWKPDPYQYTLPLIRNGEPIHDVPPHLTTRFGAEAAGFVRRHKDSPWMLYLPFNAPHTPHEPTPEKLAGFSGIQDPARRKYLAQVSLMDDAIGAVTAALAETGQRDRTLIFFFSDNGGHTPSGSDNHPLRATKGTLYEGGIRVPFIVSWPDTLPAGAVYAQPVSTVDVLATTLAAAGIAMPADKTYDSVNLIPFLTGKVAGAPHEALYWRMGGKSRAIRQGKWKLVQTGTDPELYDLDQDVAESKNLASEQSSVAARLTAALDAWNKELIDPAFPGSAVKDEDWGPGGANHKARMEKKPAKR